MRRNSQRLLRRNQKSLFEYSIMFVFSLAGVVSMAFVFRLMALDAYRQLVFAMIGAVCALLILKNPKMGIYLIGATIPMQEVGNVFLGYTVSKLVGLFSAYVWIMHRVVRGENPFAGTGRYLIPMTALLAFLSLSVAFSELPDMGVNSLLSFVGFILMYVMICKSLEDKKDIVAIFNVLVFSSLFVAIIGILQYITASPIFEISEISRARGYTRDSVTAIGRVRGTSTNPNEFAMHLMLILPLALFMFMNEKKRIRIKVFYLAVAVIYCFAIFFSQSRAAWLALVAVFVCLILFQQRGRVLSFLVLALFCGFFLMFGAKYSERVQMVTEYETTSRRDPSITNRIDVYKVSIKMFMDHPILGVGINQTKKRIVEYGLKGMQTHNVFFLVLVENGIFALLLFCLMLFGTVIRLVKFKEPQSDMFYRGASTAMFATLIGHMTFGLYHDNFWMSITWYLLGIAYVIPKLREKELRVKVKDKAAGTPAAGGKR